MPIGPVSKQAEVWIEFRGAWHPGDTKILQKMFHMLKHRISKQTGTPDLRELCAASNTSAISRGVVRGMDIVTSSV